MLRCHETPKSGSQALSWAMEGGVAQSVMWPTLRVANSNSNSLTIHPFLLSLSGEAPASSPLRITTYFWPNETAQSFPYLIFSSPLLQCSSSHSFWSFEFILYHLTPSCFVSGCLGEEAMAESNPRLTKK